MVTPRPPGYWQTVGELGTLGMSFVMAIVLGSGLGIWIDRTWQTSPWGTLIGFVLGCAAAVLNVVRISRRAFGSSAPPR
jgi:ATP synthase protein I